jgi:hypothetical protein
MKNEKRSTGWCEKVREYGRVLNLEFLIESALFKKQTYRWFKKPLNFCETCRKGIIKL